jgi:signal transduction histidine kinase
MTVWMKAEQDVLVTFLLRTVRVTVWSTFLVVAALAVSLMLPGTGPNPAELALLLVVAASTGLGAALVPWDDLLGRGRGMILFYGWNTTYILMISAGVAVNGGGSSPIVLLYGLTTVFGAMAYPVRVQIVFLGYTLASYLAALKLAGWGITPSRAFLQITALGALAFLAGFLSRELTRQMRAHAEARSESERRARLLEVVARAGRQVSSLDTEQVLEAVVGGATSLGFEAANLAVFDDAGQRFRVAFASGLPDEYRDSNHPAVAGLPGLVRERETTVVIDDYSTHPNAIPLLRDRGFHAALGTPVWVKGRLDAALVAGTRERRQVTEEDVEAFELLAALAGRGLENAQRFEDEHRAVQRLAELDGLKSDFLSNVSHELRTPLTAIEGMGLTMERQWDDLPDDTKRELLARLNANAGTLHQIITTLLDYSRLEAGRLDVRAEPIELRAFVDRVVHRLGSLLQDHPTTVGVAEGLSVGADPMLLERVLENLLSNAVKHTPEGTGIEVSARLLDDAVEIAVADEGPGIPSNELRYLGDRFFRGGDPNTRQTRGTGLGLAVVREILKLHDSGLEIESEEGAGSRFFFVLPAASSDLDADRRAAASA